MSDPGLLTGVALAQLQVSYGMTEGGAERLLADARADDNGTADTVAVHVTLAGRYPETFTIEAR